MILDPQKEKFLKNFLDPNSKTFGNYRQSAMKAGYSQDYADNISVQMPKWLEDALGKTRKVIKAEKNLDMALDGLLDDPEKGKKEIQWRATEMTLKTLRRSEYSERQEITGANGEALKIEFSPVFNKHVSSTPETNTDNPEQQAIQGN